MEFSANANYRFLPSAAVATPVVDYADPTLVNNLTTGCFSLSNHQSNKLRRSSSPVNQIEYKASDLRNVPPKTDMNQVNHQKKRMKTDENDGCKQCNCKMSKCLKLYCDCFAAGVYCDSCACQSCFNKPIYVDKVIEARQQIELRNSIAFVPKVVQYSTSPAINNGDNANLSNPALARHKRGYNCKKSLCLKKYCECYQGNVGCSIGCRCEGCQNIFGKNEDYKHKEVIFDQNFSESSKAKQDQQPNGSKFEGNQYASTPSPPSPPPPPPPPSCEPFGMPVISPTLLRSHIGVTSSITPNEKGCFPSTYSSRGSLTHINQFNEVKASPHYHTESNNTTQIVDTPNLLKDNFDRFLNSSNVAPYKKLCLQHIMSEVLSMDPLITEVPGSSNDRRHQTSFPPLMH